MDISQTVSMIDLRHQYLSIKEDIDNAIHRVLNQGIFSEGEEVANFERHFAKLHGADYCIGVSNGTSAIHVILMASDIAPGDEIIVPANTCYPTVEAIILAGAIPVLVDCEMDFYGIDTAKLEKAISVKTKAIVAVHLYGQPAQLDTLKDIAKSHNILLIEDCAHSHAARFNDQPVGTFGIAGAFSFYPTKNLGALGEAGAVITNNAELANNIRAIKNHGSRTKNYHEKTGHNYRMDSLQGAILATKLQFLPQWTETRQNNASLYQEFLKNVGDLILPEQRKNASHVFHQYVIRTARRDELKKFLANMGIETAIHYPIPCHLQPALENTTSVNGDLSISEQLSQELLSLPIADHLSATEIFYISESIKEYFKDKKELAGDQLQLKSSD